MIKSILLPLDGSAYTESVLQTGIWFAEKFKAGLRVVTILDVRYFDWVVNGGAESYMPVIPSDLYRDESQKYHEKRAAAILERATNKLKNTQIKFSCERIDGAPVNQICDLSRQADLTIMGERGDFAAWSDALLGSTLEPVSRQIQSPLLIIGKEYCEIKAILCAYDGSENGSKALKFAAYVAQELSLPLDILTIHNQEKERISILGEAKKYLQNFNLSAEYRHEAGDAAKMIINSSNMADAGTLLIMGSHGKSRIKEAVLGCTTVQVMRGASKPILLAR